MTQDELTIFRLQMDLDVHRQVIHQLVKAVGIATGEPQLLLAMESQLTAKSKPLTFPNLHPAKSDLIAAEYQEAVRRFFDGM